MYGDHSWDRSQWAADANQERQVLPLHRCDVSRSVAPMNGDVLWDAKADRLPRQVTGANRSPSLNQWPDDFAERKVTVYGIATSINTADWIADRRPRTESAQGDRLWDVA